MGNETKVVQLKNKQYVTTLPRAIVQAMNINKGDTIIFTFNTECIKIKKKIEEV